MNIFTLAVAVIVSSAISGTEGFVSNAISKGSRLRSHSSVELSALWRHWIPASETDLVDGKKESSRSIVDKNEDVEMNAKTVFLSSLLVATLMVAPSASVLAVSGGGLDYAGLDISGQDYSNNNYKGKDFTQVIAKSADFSKSNLQGCRFYKSYLVNVDFSDSDITGASLEGTSMDGASLKNTVAKGTYFSKSILDTASVENADFTDAQFPPKVLPVLCDRDDMKGTNPTTGADTRDSAMCP